MGVEQREEEKLRGTNDVSITLHCLVGRVSHKRRQSSFSITRPDRY